MKITVGIFVFLAGMAIVGSAYANSYLDMLTTAPDGQEKIAPYISEQLKENNSKLNWWYDARIVTRSPVVVSPYPKYYAWARAQADNNQFDRTHEYVQDMIYVIEGGLVGWGLYELYKY